MLWCLGMYASGSTWLFNAAMQVAAAVAPYKPVVGRYVERACDVPTPDGPPNSVIIKSHDTDEAAALLLERLAGGILVSIRDPRDCVTSLLLYQRFGFAQAVKTVERSARFCARFAGDARATLLRYEVGFTDDTATLDRIAACLGGALTDAHRARIFSETRRAAIETRISGLDALSTAVRHAASGDVVDTATQWHSHHANRSGEVGRWRHMLSLGEVAAVEQALRDWMVAFGYQAEVAPFTRMVGGSVLRL